jgi:hypothetical protein
MKKTLLPEEMFNVTTMVHNRGFVDMETKTYLFFGNEMQTRTLSVSSGGTETQEWNIIAPQSPGEYKISVFSSSGDYAEGNVSVMDVKYISIRNITYPSRISLGDPVIINVTVRGLESMSLGKMSVSLGNDEDDMEFMIKPDEEKTFVFFFQPEISGRLDLSVDIFSGERYEAGFSGSINIEKETSFFEFIFSQVQGFFSWIIMSIQGVIG